MKSGQIAFGKRIINSGVFFVLVKGSEWKGPQKITGKTENNEVYDDNLYWVGGRLICRKDCLRKIWKQVEED